MIHTTKHEFTDVYSLHELRLAIDATKHWPEDSSVEITDYGTMLTISHTEEA